MQRDSITSFLQLLESESGHESRLFIGSMPIATAKKMAPQIDNTRKYWWSRIRKRGGRPNNEENTGEWDEESIPDIEAYRFFMHKGGKREEWTSQFLRKSVKQDMLKRLQQSGWTNLFRQKNVLQTEPQRWVGTTFIIGKDFLGLPLEYFPLNPDDVPPVSPARNVSSPISRNSESTPEDLRNSRTMSTSSINNSTQGPSNSTTALVQRPPPIQVVPSSPDRPVAAGPSTPPPLTTFRSIFGPSSPSSSPLRSSFKPRQPDTTDPGAGRSVQFTPSLGPASPRKVLNRSPASVPHTSAGASASRGDGHAQESRDVIRRERMLVRKGYTKSGRTGRYFSAIEAAKLDDFQSLEWKEFLVVWRKQQLELYEDYSLSIKEKLLGHKHLAYVIPLDPAKAGVSLYSFIDLTFCLSCKELTDRNGKRSITSQLPYSRATGTHLFVFKTKVRTSGIDWLWDLWKELGYGLPRSIEIHCPLVQAFVKLHVPDNFSKAQNDALFSVKNVIEMCQKGLQVLPSWDFLIGQHLKKGASLHLCWRNEAVLDWIQWETDLIGKPRDASILYGLCLKRPHEITRLELRIGEHRSACVMKDAGKVLEPPPVEGYVYRIKLKTNARILLYLSVHSGCLFFISPARAYPPRLPLPTANNDSGKNSRTFSEGAEKRRGALQAFFSDTFIDLRKIKAVQRVCIVRPDRYRDAQDVGGDEGLRTYPGTSKVALRFRRSFVLLMENGHIFRFETHSCEIAQQWVDQLSKLVGFWKQKHRADASREMKILDAFSRKMYTSGPAQLSSMKPEDVTEDISLFWDRCGVYGCQPIALKGRLFVRQKLQGQYRLVQLVLVAGHVLQFDILPSGQNLRSWTISLLDAYVCSGHFATQSLPVHEFSIVGRSIPRRFQDGLQIEDHELDLVFLIWYRPHAAKTTFINEDRVSIPAINAKHKVVVIKARSKLERDAWCWAVNEEIERTARRHVSRELKLHEGGLTSKAV